MAREVKDSQEEGDSEQDALPPGSQTDLESALPPVNTDKQAIEEYETMGPQNRLKFRKWTKGKTSIYVDAFNLALDTVLEEEGDLFDEAELAVFDNWRNSSYEAQYLYVRLFLRKTSAWFRVNRLKYHSDIGDMQVAVNELLELRLLPKPPSERVRHPGEIDTRDDVPILDNPFAFAEESDAFVKSIDDAASLLLLDELKLVAKEARAQGKTKRELIESLKRASQNQSGLAWRGLKRSNTEDSIKSEGSLIAAEGEEDYSKTNRDSYFMDKILEITGPCIRLSPAVFKLFERVHLVFYRSTEWSEKSLTTIILAQISRRNFPEYIVCRSANIFSGRLHLLEFDSALRTQAIVDELTEGKGPIIPRLEKVRTIYEDVYPSWKSIVAEEQEKEMRIYESGEGAYLRRFSPAWVYTRIIHKGLDSLARFRERKREHELLTELLDQRLFHAARRGSWYQRKALLEEHYMWDIEPNEGRNEEAQKRHWKKIALRTCEEGLQDRECHVIFHYDLQKRIMKLEKSLKIAKREQHDFAYNLLIKPLERAVEGTRIERTLGPTSGGRRGSEPQTSRRGTKTIWLDPREEDGECGVEAMCLSWYRDQGWKGYHSEGGIVRTLFGFLFYDIIFTYIPNVFQTAFQTCPLDLHTDAFYPSRISEINRRLAEISNGDALMIFKEVYKREHEKQTCVIGIDWSYDVEDLEEIIMCFKGEALAVVCKVMAQEYQQRGGGIPDLFLWHPQRKEVMFSEVKSENDRLSDTQRLWIHVLSGAGIKVELCNAVAKEQSFCVDRTQMLSTEITESHPLNVPHNVWSLSLALGADPNGLFVDPTGTYHLYYQRKSSEGVWGHATSTDLYNWKNQPIAISPSTADPQGLIFSGSAVLDPNNTSGFFPAGSLNFSSTTVGTIAAYTLDHPTAQVQNIAYSTDNGYTFTNYSGNPVLNVQNNPNFRDPHITFHGPTNRWVMAVSWAELFTIGFFTSPDMKTWTPANNFSAFGLLGLQWECPNLVEVPLLIDAYAPPSEKFSPTNINGTAWLLQISINPGAPQGGSISQYFPGSFNGTHFEPADGAARLTDWAKDNYAGQFYSGIDPRKPQVLMTWASNWQYTNALPTADEGWRSAMGVPRYVGLARNVPRAP
ncbi:MAG: hypothetical protein LQ340_006579, partial [Diploschistes diacapsis]